MVDYYLESWDPNQKENKRKAYVSDNITLYQYIRKYGNNKAVFYTDDSIFTKRRMYIFIGPFLEKAILSYAEICAKCTKHSIKEAFKNCPHLLAWFKDVLKEKRNGVIVELQLPDGRIYCIQGRYDALLGSKKSTFMKLCRHAEIIRTELSLINKSALKVQKSFIQKVGSFLGRNLKYIVRGGVIIAASMIGANIDLPDFDFDVETPDFDVDFGDGLTLDTYEMGQDLNTDSFNAATTVGVLEASYEDNVDIGSSAVEEDEYNCDDEQASRGEWITEPCEYCNKTGYSLIDKEYWPHLSGERLTYWCNICKCKDYSHYHNRCPHCNGLGYNRRYVD